MPLYFAYGANLDREGMGRRCPHSTPVAPCRLIGHAFFITADGYASVRREPRAVVHGLLWQLALADVAALDRFEDVAGGLYTKVTLSVVKAVGSARALVYVGRSHIPGAAKPGYMEGVVEAAERCGLPAAYRAALRTWLPRASGRRAADR